MVSAVTFWEVAIKRSLNKPDFRSDVGPLRAGMGISNWVSVVRILWSWPSCQCITLIRLIACWSRKPRQKA